MSCIDVVEAAGRFAIFGLIGLPHEVGSSVLGHRVIAADKDLDEFLHRCDTAFVAVGQIKSPDLRMRLFRKLVAGGCTLPVVVSPQARVSKYADVGQGTIIMHGAIVNAGARVGENCIVNSLSLIEHGAQVGDHCHISTHAVLNSNVRVGVGTFVGSGATVRQSIELGHTCVIGMGVRVLKDCPAGTWLLSDNK
jgi:sugar O-acyltransferase (sialic acid O-acetyltransferase NeuD family)